MCPLKFEQSTSIDLNSNSIYSSIFEQLLKVEQVIKESKISTWCDHIPEWQMLVTNILQYVFVAEDVFFNTTNSSVKYLEESLQYYDKIKDYFKNNEVQEQLFVLFELIKQEAKLKENFNLQYNDNNELFNSRLCSLNYSNKMILYDNNIKINYPVNSIFFKYKVDMPNLILKKKIGNIFDLGIINQLLNKFSLKNNF